MRKPYPSPADIHTVAFDFDGVFTDNKVWVAQDGQESVRCDRSDGLAFDFVRAFQRQGKLTTDFFILSKETNPVVLARARKLRLDCHHSVGNKLAFMKDYLIKHFPDVPEPFTGLIYVGNDLNDLPLMQRAGYSVAPSDAHPKVQEIASIVLEQRGGEGFVRAFIEKFLGINQLSKEELNELVSYC